MEKFEPGVRVVGPHIRTYGRISTGWGNSQTIQNSMNRSNCRKLQLGGVK
ncbi:hypothetical protein BCVP_CDS0234 [Bacillus phage BC-VP]|nr:hypothetical protein BCVP_CDS0234 [Bacillus phage BC-VP]